MNEFKEGRIMSNDTIETILSGSIIQHGKFNDRIYLMKLKKADLKQIIHTLSDLASQNSYSKIFCKVPAFAAPEFIANGFFQEAVIPGFFNNETDAFFLSKFLNSDRLMNIETDKLYQLADLLDAYSVVASKDNRADGQYDITRLNGTHAEIITDVYKEVFLSYPFPIHDPEYIKSTMADNIQYYGIYINNDLAAVASAEVDEAGGNAEMTDFATRPKYRGKGLAVQILKKMEQEMINQGIHCLFTIARLNSIAMNKTFLKLNYKYSGTLIKNTNIAGQIESMNIHYKHV